MEPKTKTSTKATKAPHSTARRASKLILALAMAMLASLTLSAPGAEAAENSPDTEVSHTRTIVNEHGTFEVKFQYVMDGYAGGYDSYFSDDRCGPHRAWRILAHYSCLDIGELDVSVAQTKGLRSGIKFDLEFKVPVRGAQWSYGYGVPSVSFSTNDSICSPQTTVSSVDYTQPLARSKASLTNDDVACHIKSRGTNFKWRVDQPVNAQLKVYTNRGGGVNETIFNFNDSVPTNDFYLN